MDLLKRRINLRSLGLIPGIVLVALSSWYVITGEDLLGRGGDAGRWVVLVVLTFFGLILYAGPWESGHEGMGD